MAFAVKLALVDPDGTETEAGTLRAALLLVRVTLIPVLGAGEPNVTVQEVEPAPTINELAQLNAAKDWDEVEPFPCNFTALARVVFVLVIALTLSCPVESIADPGL